MNRLTKVYLNSLGVLLTLLSLFFIYTKIKEYKTSINFSVFNNHTVFLFCMISFLYAVSNFLLCFSWYWLLKYQRVTASFKSSYEIFGISQLGKYIPGNIFQFAGRQALAMSNGYPAKPIAKTLLWEAVLLILSGSLFLPLLLSIHFNFLSLGMSLTIFFICILVISVLLILYVNFYVVYAMLGYVVFLIISGLCFNVVVSLIEPVIISDVSTIVIVSAAFVFAWLAGLLVPGAPAGIGIRETVLLALLLPLNFEQKIVLQAVVVSRLITVTGDVTFFFISILSKKLLRFY